MVGSRSASMVLPLPGGPIISRLWLPAAATSNMRRAPCWPRTSRMSTRRDGELRAGRRCAACKGMFPRRCATTSSSDSAVQDCTCCTPAASELLPTGTMACSMP